VKHHQPRFLTLQVLPRAICARPKPIVIAVLISRIRPFNIFVRIESEREACPRDTFFLPREKKKTKEKEEERESERHTTPPKKTREEEEGKI